MSNVIRLSLDTEFNERGNLGHPMAFDLISFGLVNIDMIDQDCYDHAYGFYRVLSDFNKSAAETYNPFVAENVLPKLYVGSVIDIERTLITTTVPGLNEQVKNYLAGLVADNPEAETLEIWAKNGCYDNVALCRVFNGMDRLYEYTQSLGLTRTRFKDLDNLTYPAAPITEKPSRDAKFTHNAFYDAYEQARIIRWIESEQRQEIYASVQSPQDAIKSGLVHN